MKIGLAQINPTIGAFADNAKKLVNAYRAALDEGAELVLSPECALIGYPARDLLLRPRFIEESLAVLEEVAKEIGEVPLLVGFSAPRAPGAVGQPLYNSVAVLHKGVVSAQRHKSLLPTYDVFDERRYYQPAEEVEIWEFAGRKIGITVCEDLWTGDFLPLPLYSKNPVAQLREQGAELIVNLSASPFSRGKQAVRRELLCAVATAHCVPIAYCNAVGGNDQLIFDGGSLLVSADGQVVGEAAQFREETAVYETHGQARGGTSLAPMEELYEALVLGMRDYAQKCGFSQACLGLSGGIDSALTAALAAEAFGPSMVHGLTMPSPYSSKGSVTDSFTLANNLGIRCDEVSIEASFTSVKEAMQGPFDGAAEDVTEENMQARIRGVYLMSLSNKSGALLLTTGNKSELAVGYCTIYGDMCGGLAVISDLPKTTVYELARWINREKEIIPWSTIQKAPSAELRPDQQDQDTLPEYEVLDTILDYYVEKLYSPQEIIEVTGYDESLVRWVQRRVDFNEWKRQQSAVGLRVTTKAFGVGRRIPIAQRFH